MNSDSLMSDQRAIYYTWATGSFPWASFGTLTLTEEELVFKADVLLWTPRLQRYAIRKITSAQARPGRRARTRRLTWILSGAVTPVTGLLGLPWLAAFWPRAGSPTLEVYVRRWLFGGRRVFIVDNPAEWAAAINRLIGASGGGEGQARGA